LNPFWLVFLKENLYEINVFSIPTHQQWSFLRLLVRLCTLLAAYFPHSVALMQLRFARRDQLATGLAPVGMRPMLVAR